MTLHRDIWLAMGICILAVIKLSGIASSNGKHSLKNIGLLAAHKYVVFALFLQTEPLQ